MICELPRDTVKLAHFEALDAARGEQLRMGDFTACADPRAYVRASNRVFGALVDICGLARLDSVNDHEAFADEVIAACLIGSIDVEDEL